VFTENPKVDILESGTYLGMGSTTSLAASLIRNKAKVNKFFTIEADFDLFRQASQNLKKFDFITPIWGLSVSVKEAADFIAKDEAIKNHEKYPDVFIDEIDNPTAFYTNEIEGKLSDGNFEKSWRSRLKSKLDRVKFTFKEDCFKELLPQLENLPVVLLDSAGGLGYLEFTRVVTFFSKKNYILILDDIHHLKHFRSFEYINTHREFKILGQDLKNGWVIAEHSV
jgi:hypothetical protein